MAKINKDLVKIGVEIKSCKSCGKVEVVRCKDCKYWENIDNVRGACSFLMDFAPSNFYCGYGEAE